MGGAAAGEIASSLAVDEVMRLLTGRTEAPLPGAEAGHLRGQRGHLFPRPAQPKLSGMGTTLVGLVTEEEPRAGCSTWATADVTGCATRLEQITLDHSLVEEQVGWAA
jgi:serine/threonine protein phosphatase PrpC